MDSWQPQPELLQQVAHMMQCTLAADTSLQKQAYEALAAHTQNPEFVRYLAYVFARCSNLGVAARVAAGLTLKRCIDTSYAGLPPAIQHSVRLEVLRTLADPEPDVRHASANAVSAIVRHSELAAWPELAPSLISLLDPANAAAADGALTALGHLSEDVASQFDSAALGHPLTHLIPLLLRWMGAPGERARREATKCVTNFVYTMSGAVQSNLDNILGALAALTTDPSPSVRKAVCYAFCTLTELRADRVWPLLQPIIRFELGCTMDTDSEVAMAACDFWSVLLEVLSDAGDEAAPNSMSADVAPFLPDIVRALLARMELTEDDLANYGEEDGGVADREQDIRPHIHRPRAAAPAGDASAAAGGVNGLPAPEDGGSGDAAGRGRSDSEEDDGGDASDPHAEVHTWTLRRAAASALDSLTLVFGDRVLPSLLPELNARLSAAGDAEASWRAREVGVLALGAVAEGCWEGIGPYMGQLFPFLLALTGDKRPMVRSIALWCLAKYVPWALEEELTDEAVAGRYLDPLMLAVQPRLLDAHKKVQEAACNAVLNIAESAQSVIAPHVPALVSTLVVALGRYQTRNRLHLYDAIGALAESVGPADFAIPETAVLLPPLMARYEGLRDEDHELVPLLECFTALVTTMGHMMANVAPSLFARALRLVETNTRSSLAQQAAEDAAAAAAAAPPSDGSSTRENRPANPPHHHAAHNAHNDFLIVGLDLLAGLAEGFQDSFLELVVRSGSSATLLQLLLECCRMPPPAVRQSAFALLGELAKFAMPELQPHAAAFLEVATLSMRDTHTNANACNNAVWAAGEIVLRVGSDAAGVAPKMVERLVAIVNNRKNSRPQLENSAICLGRLAVIAPSLMAASLPEYLLNWLKALTLVGVPDEREQAFAGLCLVIRANPSAGAGLISALMFAFSTAEGASPQLLHSMRAILGGYKRSLPPAQWDAQTAVLSTEVKGRMRASFGEVV